jgi:proline iminopeptidase
MSSPLVTVRLAWWLCVAAAVNVATPVDAVAAGRHLVVDGVRLWLREAGRAKVSQPPVVFLHGGPGYNSHSFAVLAGRGLEGDLRMIYLDQRGSGQSERPWTRDYSIARLVADLEGVRRQLGVTRMVLMGHSFGGLLALEYAAAHPKRVARLVLVSAASDIPASCQARVDFLGQRYPVDLQAARDRQVQGQLGRHVCDLAFNTAPAGAHQRINDETMFPDPQRAAEQAAVDAASGLKNTGELGAALFSQGLFDHRFTRPDRLTMPVLVMAGAHDHAIGLQAQRALAASLRQGRLVAFSQSGHFLYLDETRKFQDEVRRFLR